MLFTPIFTIGFERTLVRNIFLFHIGHIGHNCGGQSFSIRSKLTLRGRQPLYRLTPSAKLDRSRTGTSNLVTQGWLQERYGFKHLTEGFCLRAGRPAGMKEATGHETAEEKSGHICQQDQLMCNNTFFSFHTATMIDTVPAGGRFY